MIKVEHLSKSFGALTVLKDITTEIQKGEVVSIIGPSGTGKSTFLRCLNLLERPTGGSIHIDGVDIMARSTDINAMRRRIGMVFQSFNLYPHMTALRNVTLALVKVLGKPRAEAERIGMAALDRVGLADKARSYPGELSGGQQQRVAIARALANDPPVVLADEPTAHLDHTQIESVRSTFRAIADAGRIVIISTHDDRLGEVADRVVQMRGAGSRASEVAELEPAQLLVGSPV